MDVGDRIRAARRNLGLSQRDVASAVGVSHGAVARWEGGGGGNGIATDNLVKIARVLQIRASSLLGEEAGVDHDAIAISDPREIALIELFRRLSPKLREIHLNLLYENVGVISSGQPQQEGNPPKRRKIVRRK
jgi:transcriptional regulator with XRE-family HTH domain